MLSHTAADALSFALTKHQAQKRKLFGEPYIVHPLEVGSYLKLLNAPAAVVYAGYLHDTLEDTDATQQEILDKFGSEILRIVLSNTEDKSLSWEERKQHTIDHIKNLDEGCFLLLLFDKFSNLSDIWRFYKSYGDELWNRFNRGKDKQQWYYEGLLHEFIQYVSEHTFNKEQEEMLPYILNRFKTMCIDLFSSDIPD